ncbi:MAG: hypothetical protein CMH34_09200 [Microbacterium sp.]|nr:hypothetical protein [Microbacterium sp.]
MRLVGAWNLLVQDGPRLTLPDWYLDYRFTIPILVGVLGLVILAFPVTTRGAAGAADLTPRSPVTFALGWWFAPPAAILVVILIITFTAGAASEPDPETGRYIMYMVDGGVMSVGTSIYGWFYSTPAMVALAVLLIVTAVDLILIARPAMEEDREADARVRRIRTRNVLTVTTGAMLVHLGLLFGSLAGTAAVQGSASTSQGLMMMWTPIAALEPVFRGAAYVSAALGIALWVSVALTAIPTRRRVPVTAST